MWRFVQVSDPHLGSSRDGKWNNRFICSMMPEVMACLRRDLNALKPEFILATGDLCSHQSRDAMYEARNEMEAFQIPYYPMGGNHDFVTAECRSWFMSAFAHRLPDTTPYYAFSHRNLHFCVLDAWWVWQDGSICPFSEESVAEKIDDTLDDAHWAIPPAQLEWLLNDLKQHEGIPTMMAVHYPAVPIPQRLKQPGLKDGGCLENGDILLEMLQRFPQVKALFSGHVHLNFIEQIGGITQIATGALPEFPIEYRDIQVFEDRMEIKTLGLSDPSFAKRSLIEGKSYTAGETRDREAVIPL